MNELHAVLKELNTNGAYDFHIKHPFFTSKDFEITLNFRGVNFSGSGPDILTAFRLLLDDLQSAIDEQEYNTW